MAEYITSDTHFDHRNIMDYCNRPFNSVEDMNEGIIEAWNRVIGSGDVVYHLGDLSMKGRERTEAILRRLNGRIVLHAGNHERMKDVRYYQREGLLEDYHEVGQCIKRHGHQFWLTHYPMEIGLRPGKWSLSGHIHNRPNQMMNQINVGIDAPNELVKGRSFGEPIPMTDVLAYVEKKNEDVKAMKKRVSRNG